jgi:hypothetical protein
MPIGLPLAILLAGGAAAGASVYSSKQAAKSAKNASGPTPLPQAPSIESSQQTASDAIRKKRTGLTRTNYTSPLGVAGEAGIAKKTLLGN